MTIAETVDAHIERTEKPRPPDGLWHPSSLFDCARSAVYSKRGIGKSDGRGPRSRGILRLGTGVHDIVQRALTEDAKALAVYNEVEVSIPELGVYGHSDTLLQITEDEWELLEFKSISAKSLEYLLRRGGLPKEGNVKQARVYAMGLRLVGGWVDTEEVLCREGECPDREFGGTHGGHIPPLGDRLKRIRLVYFSRDDLRGEEFVVEIDPAWEQFTFPGLIARLSEYEQDGGALPPRLPLENGKKNWLCAGYCEYRTRCWDQDDAGVDL